MTTSDGNNVPDPAEVSEAEACELIQRTTIHSIYLSKLTQLVSEAQAESQELLPKFSNPTKVEEGRAVVQFMEGVRADLAELLRAWGALLQKYESDILKK